MAEDAEPRLLSELFEFVVERPVVRCARCGPLLIQDWSGQPLAIDQELIGEAYEDMSVRYPQGFASLAFLRMNERIGSPDADVRRRAIEQFRRFDAYMTISAIVLDSEGLAAQTARTFMNALLMVVRPSAPIKVFSNLDMALDWMLGAEDRLAPELVAGAEELRALLRAELG